MMIMHSVLESSHVNSFWHVTESLSTVLSGTLRGTSKLLLTLSKKGMLSVKSVHHNSHHHCHAKVPSPRTGSNQSSAKNSVPRNTSQPQLHPSPPTHIPYSYLHTSDFSSMEQ